MAASQDYSVSLLETIDFAPSSTVAEILQNIRTILTTRRGTVPLDRDFGLSWNWLDQPLPLAQMLMKAEIINAIQTYEPRAAVKAVTFAGGTENAMDGILIPTVTVTLAETAAAASQATAGTGSGTGTAETVDTSDSSTSDTVAVTSLIMSQVVDLTERLEDIEQSDYSELYQNGET